MLVIWVDFRRDVELFLALFEFVAKAGCMYLEELAVAIVGITTIAKQFVFKKTCKEVAPVGPVFP